ncbi:uncharacterized protein ARMOST_20353 [Armillaria ostoyae]|uniref:Uncharacterized protein n=1 Tax=Armillaria ostoyae TaxID=47428 RepID=A0A284S753_ARMOS|nr:uncharacterized protein ARMOST_20353 [Armillaria ostoyae]
MGPGRPPLYISEEERCAARHRSQTTYHLRHRVELNCRRQCQSARAKLRDALGNTDDSSVEPVTVEVPSEEELDPQEHCLHRIEQCAAWLRHLLNAPVADWLDNLCLNIRTDANPRQVAEDAHQQVQFYPTAGHTWEERWLAEGEKEQELEQALQATYIEVLESCPPSVPQDTTTAWDNMAWLAFAEAHTGSPRSDGSSSRGSTIWPDPDSEDVDEEDMPASEPDSDAASQELSSVPMWDSTEFQQMVAVWGAHALQALENDGTTVEPAGQTTPVEERHFAACEVVVEVCLAGWLDWVRRQDDMARRRRLLAHIDELEAELEVIDVSYPIPDPPFEWFGSDGYDESGFLT